MARAATAGYVVLHHLYGSLPGLAGVIFSFGQEAVLVFFLLSGFVIFANERDRVSSLRGYYLRRIRRIYPPLVLAMAVSTVCWAIGWIGQAPTWQSAIGTLLALQDISFLKPGVVVDPYLGNDPLWSLSYEVFFYLVFPFVMIAWRRSSTMTRWVVPIVAAMSYLSYLAVPNHVSLVGAYFGIWWTGAMWAHLYMRDDLRWRRALPEIIGMSALLATTLVGVGAYGFAGLGYFPFLMVRHAAVALVLGAVLMSPLRRLFGFLTYSIRRPAGLVAGISYGIYVVHYPLLVQPGIAQSWAIVPMALVTVAVAWLVDRALPRLLPAAPRR